jgi:hypothetical protein
MILDSEAEQVGDQSEQVSRTGVVVKQSSSLLESNFSNAAMIASVDALL